MQEAYTKLPTYYINITTYSYYESLFCDNIIFFLCITLEDPCISITVTSSTIVIFSGEVYSMQHYLIMIVSNLRQIGGFLRVLRFHSTIKLTATIYLTYC